MRVFVGRDDLEAHDWVGRMALGFSKPLAPYAGSLRAEDLQGDGKGILLLRDGNVGLLIRVDPAGAIDAETWARTLLGSLVPDSPWPAPPALKQDGDRWTVVAPGAKQVAFHGGHLVANQGLVFTEPPKELVAWDAYGRASVWTREVELSSPKTRRSTRTIGSASRAPHCSRHECMLSIGLPTSTVAMPSSDAAMGPIVVPHARSERDTKVWYATSSVAARLLEPRDRRAVARVALLRVDLHDGPAVQRRACVAARGGRRSWDGPRGPCRC